MSAIGKRKKQTHKISVEQRKAITDLWREVFCSMCTWREKKCAEKEWFPESVRISTRYSEIVIHCHRLFTSQ